MAKDDGSTPIPDTPSDKKPDSPGIRKAHCSGTSSVEWAACYRSEMPYLVRYLMHTFNQISIHDSQEAAHEAFVELFDHWETVAKHRAWLRTVAYRKMLARLNVQETSLNDLSYDPAAAAASEYLILNEEEQAARIAISQLPVKQRQVFSLHYDGFSYSEIAQVLLITEAAARKNMERARDKLEEILACTPENHSEE
jgi:RNA polymerase sigma factor (sigma-70 family)